MKIIGRRVFLQGAGGLLVAMPPLASLGPAKAASPVAPGPRRLITVAHDNGVYPLDFYPSDELLKGVPFQDGRRQLRLADVPGKLSTVLDQRFDRFRNNLIILRGLDFLAVMPQTGHDDGHLLAGTLARNAALHRHPSLDHVLAASSRVYPTKPRVPVCVWSRANGGLSISHSFRNGQMVTKDALKTAADIYRNLFTNLSEAEIAQRLRLKRFVVDEVLEDYNALSSNPRLSQHEKLQLDLHVSSLHELQGNLQAPLPALSCNPTPEAPVEDFSVLPLDKRFDLMFDLVVTALRCDASRIFTLVLAPQQDRSVYRELITPLPFATAADIVDYHTLSHRKPSDPVYRAVTNYFAQSWARLLEKLSEVEDPTTGDTYLDSSVVMYLNSLSNASNHERFELPSIVAGGKHSNLKTGQFLDFRDPGRAIKMPRSDKLGGANYLRLPLTILNAFGHPMADFQQPHVEPGFGTHVIRTEIASLGYEARRTEPLPGMLS